MIGIYLVDNDRSMTKKLKEAVERYGDVFEITGISGELCYAFVDILKSGTDVVFYGMWAHGPEGDRFIEKIKSRGCEAEFVAVSSCRDFDAVRDFFVSGGFDYLLKPCAPEKLDDVLKRLEPVVIKKQKNRKTVTANPGFNDLVRFVDENFTEKISLNMLSEMFGFSRNYICALFRKYYGCSLNSYLTDKRMKLAGELMADRSILVKQVGVMTGYSDYYHFFKVFKDYYGLSPKEYRNSL